VTKEKIKTASKPVANTPLSDQPAQTTNISGPIFCGTTSELAKMLTGRQVDK